MEIIKGFKIIHLNVRSFFKKREELFLLYNNYDIICFTETWLTSLIPDNMLTWSGFTLWRADRYKVMQESGNWKGGGILVYTRDKYSKYVTELESLSYMNSDIESLTLKLSYPFMRQQ